MRVSLILRLNAEVIHQATTINTAELSIGFLRHIPCGKQSAICHEESFFYDCFHSSAVTIIAWISVSQSYLRSIKEIRLHPA